jgi:hypothetical protein
MDIRRLDEAAKAIENRCRADFPESFTSLSVDRSGGGILVWRGDDTRIDEAVRRDFPDVPVTFRRGGHDQHTLERILDRVERDREYWRGQGVDIATLGLLDGRGVTIGTPQAATAAHAIEERYGAEYVIVKASTPALLPPFRGPVPEVSRRDPYGRRQA